MQFIKKFIKSVRFLFVESKFIDIILNDKESKREITLILREQKQKRIDELLEKVNVGDIVWVRRYSNEKEKSSISIGHEFGPALVIGKCEKGLICSKGMGTIPRNSELFYKFNSDDYENFYKDTYFWIFRFEIINDYRYIKTIGTAKKKDLENIMLKIKRNKVVYCYHNDDRYMIDLFLQCSDIINYNNKNYIVLDILDDKISCIALNGENRFIKERDLKRINFNDIIYLDKNVEYKIISILSENVYKQLLIRYKKYLEEMTNLKTPQRGSIIEKDNINYYIYGEMGSNWLVFEITDREVIDWDKLKIANKNFYTKYNDTVISKKDKFKVLSLADEKEVNNIKNSRKDYLYKYKDKKNSSKKKGIFVGSIVEHRLYFEKRFIVIEKINGRCYCCDIDNIKNGLLEFVDFNDYELRVSSDNSINGIVWLEQNPDFEMKNINKEINEIINTQNSFIESNIIVKNEVNNINLISLYELTSIVSLLGNYSNMSKECEKELMLAYYDAHKEAKISGNWSIMIDISDKYNLINFLNNNKAKKRIIK